MKTTNSIRPPFFFTMLFLCMLFLRFQAFSQPSMTNQIVTLQVAELNALSVTENLLIVPGEVKPEIEYQATASTRLVWTSNGENRKISVKKKTHGGALTITVEDLGGDHNLETEGRTLRDGSTFDLVTNLSRAAGSCLVRFEAVSFDPKYHNEMQTVVYTITSS